MVIEQRRVHYHMSDRTALLAACTCGARATNGAASVAYRSRRAPVATPVQSAAPESVT